MNNEYIEFRKKGRRVKNETRRKISRALRGKKRGRKAAVGALAGATAGAGFIGLAMKLRKGKNGVGTATPGVSSKGQSILNGPGGSLPLLPTSSLGPNSQGPGGALINTVLPTGRVQSSQLDIRTKPNIIRQAGVLASKIPGAKAAVGLGAATRQGFQEGLTSNASADRTGRAARAGRGAARIVYNAKAFIRKKKRK